MVYSAQSFTLLGFLVLFVIQTPAFSQSKVDSSARDFSIQLTTMREGYDGKFCWVHARTGMIPTRRDSDPIMVMTSQKLQLSGSDVFYALHTAYSSNAGIVWSPLTPQDPFTRRKVGKDQEETVCDFTPQWHEA
ncbi:MAG: exo-alpha-sialidase, partial [Planctomycetota bacterium]|nr:exo-alpha-sialidase [Planctomycetota bacterium]